MKISENVGIEQIIKSVFDFFSLSHNMSFFNISNIQVCNEIEGEFDAQVIRDGCLRPEDLVVQIEYDKKSIGQREYIYNLYVRLLHELTHVYDFKLLYDKYNTVCEHPYQIAYDMWSEFNAWTYSEVTMLNKYNE